MARGTGRTIAQLEEAPQNAIFIWCNEHIGYARALALWLGRHDIKVVAPSSIVRDRVLSGYTRDKIVVDHAAELTADQKMILFSRRTAHSLSRKQPIGWGIDL